MVKISVYLLLWKMYCIAPHTRGLSIASKTWELFILVRSESAFSLDFCCHMIEVLSLVFPSFFFFGLGWKANVLINAPIHK